MLNKLLLTILLTLPSLGYEIVIDKTMARPTFSNFTRDNVKEIVTNTKTGVMWQDDASVKRVKQTWSEAKRYCQALNYGGHSDWYLPNISELESLVNTKKSDPAIKGNFKNIISSYYWSSSSVVSYSSYAWYVSFLYGNSDYDGKTSSYYVRCARAGQSDTLDFEKIVQLYIKQEPRA